MNKLFLFLSLLFLAILLGCPKPQETTKEEPPPSPPLPLVKKPVPDMTVRLASFTLVGVTKKIDKPDIEQVAKIAKREKIDVLAVQSITRYPDLKNRIDLFDEIAAAMEMRKIFGENATVSGRQTGNAVFSTFPIRSNQNTTYHHTTSVNFESALQAVIDCGIRDVVVVSTRIPDKASIGDQEACVNTLMSFSSYYPEYSIIITGNLPKSEMLRSFSSYLDARIPANENVPHIWYSSNGSLKLLSTKVESTGLGQMVVAEFGIFRKGQP